MRYLQNNVLSIGRPHPKTKPFQSIFNPFMMKKHFSLGLLLVLFACFTKTQAQCSSGLTPEWKYQNAWYTGGTVDFSSGYEVWFSAIPNALTVTVTDPAGVVHSDNYIISSISVSDAGQYIITNTATGCSETLDVTVDGQGPPSSGTSVWSESGTTANYSGEVAIGRSTVPSGYKLAVEGHVRAREVRVDQDSWPDFVFASDYDLPSLQKVREFIAEHGYLAGMPSAKEAEQNGTDLAQMDRLLLQKIEELTLYILEQETRIENLEKQLENEK